MVFSTSDLIEKYKDYSSTMMKVNSEIRKGKYIKINRGLYEDNPNVNPIYLAQYIKSPSYISFEYVLSFYGLIPESVHTITCATLHQRHRYQYKNHFGNYSYQDVPAKIFYQGISTEIINGYSYCIASKEKAFCDFLYTKRPVTSIKQLKQLLFEDLRIDVDEFKKLNMEDLLTLGPLYKKRDFYFLSKLIKKNF